MTPEIRVRLVPELKDVRPGTQRTQWINGVESGLMWINGGVVPELMCNQRNLGIKTQ